MISQGLVPLSLNTHSDFTLLFLHFQLQQQTVHLVEMLASPSGLDNSSKALKSLSICTQHCTTSTKRRVNDNISVTASYSIPLFYQTSHFAKIKNKNGNKIFFIQCSDGFKVFPSMQRFPLAHISMHLDQSLLYCGNRVVRTSISLQA